MASSSSSPPPTSSPPAQRSCTYDAFLSFRGEDTRNGFTGHLYAALDRKGVKTFRDDKELERGEVISAELLKAIEESMFAIIVLSPNYAFSSWCLVELHKIVECSKSQGLSIVPIFYGVEPSDVRSQKGSFGEAFKKHEERFGQNCEKIRRWRDALTEVANHSGWDSSVDKHEATLVESIADHIFKKLIPKLPSSSKNLVGIASRREEVKRHICGGLNDVRFIGIWGMGGIGKTTIARAVYDDMQKEFKVHCFLAKVREIHETNGIVGMQRELVKQINMSADTVYNEYEGRKIIRNSLCNKKVLLVLDDVSDEVELQNLAGDKDWFGLGSRIIITTRDIHLLKNHEVHETYEVQGLVDSESLDLFCSKAFKQKKPDEKHLDLAKDVVKYSGGLPLALEVLGSHFFGRHISVWYSDIEKMKSQSAPTKRIHDTLKISYDSLDSMEKNIFLDIACFFKGNKVDDVIDVLNKCGYSAVSCINILIERCLVKVDEYDEDSFVFEMHDLLQEMGRNIVIEESPENPRKRSRLWSSEDINLVFQNNKGSEAIQGVVLKEGWSAPVRDWSAEAFSNMTQLKLLIVGGFAVVRCDFISLPTSIKVLHWSFYPLKTLPLSDQQNELVEIILKRSKIEYLWHGQKFLRKLKHLDLSGSDELKQTPDLSEVPNLQTLVLEGCTDLTEVHPSVVRHKSLTLLDLTRCIRLEALPGKLEMSSLKELLLDGCLHFENLPEFGKCMTSLSRLSLRGTSIKKLPTSLGCLVGLEHLDLSSCSPTEESFLLLLDFGHFPSLMDLTGSDELKQTPDLSEVPNLQTLILEGRTDLTKVHPSVVHHKSLILLDLTGCESLKALPGKLEMSSLKGLLLDGCSRFENLPEFGKCMTSLSTLSLKSTSIKKLPTSLGCLVGLEHLNLSSCSLTEESFPPDFGHLPSLTDLDLSMSDLVSIPRSIHELPKLKCLKLNLCSKLRCLPKLPSSVRELEAYDCDSLDISEFDILSKVCGVFVSPSQDPSPVLLEMVISGSKIPSWFGHHQEDGNSISIPCDDPRNERSGIALCFQVTVDEKHFFGLAFGLHDGNNRFITQRITDISLKGNYYLYIICLSKDCFSDGLHQGTCFELSILDSDDQPVKVSSAARWVSKDDIKDLEKSEIERSKKKRQKII